MVAKAVKINSSIKIRAYPIIEQAVETGLNWGWSRSHKYVDNPDEHHIQEQMLNEVMLALSEVLSFDDDFLEEEAPAKKKKAKATVKLNAYRIISEAVTSGIAYGWNRAHKHVDNPDEHHIKEQMHNAITNELCDILDFDDGL